jgi:2'-5' RNA ligase
MFDQLSMFDTSPPTPPVPPVRTPVAPSVDGKPGVPHALFFAAVASAAGTASLHERAGLIDQQFGIGGRPLEAERLHVSLFAVGAYLDVRPDMDIARWCRAGAAVRCLPAEIVFDRVASFGGEGNPLVFKSADDVGVAGLLALHQALGIELANTGERIKRQRIRPHMTMSYRGKRIAETAIEPVRWQLHELVLVDSHVGAHRHDVIGRWPLLA